MVQLEFKLAYYIIAILDFSHYASEILPKDKLVVLHTH